MTILTNRQEQRRFFRFIVVGCIGAVVDFGVMNLLTKLFNLPLVWAGTISFICAVLSNFLWNRYWTYPDSRSRPVAHQLAMFFLVNVAGIIIRFPILHFLEPPILQTLEQSTTASISNELLAKNFTLAIAIGVVLVWNFFVNRYWTYNDIDKVKP